MGTVAGRSAGFGRIRGDTRPSPFTPFHLPSAPLPFAHPPRRSALRPARLAGLAIVVLALFAVVYVAGFAGKARAEPQTVAETPALRA